MNSELSLLINSPGMWIASSLFIVVMLIQVVLYHRMAWKEADRLGISVEKRIAGMRSAAITAIGPAMSPVIIMMAMMAVVGAPTTWLRMNNIGAARTELAMMTMAIGVNPEVPAGSIMSFAYGLWGMALNDAGWMVVTLLLTHRMGKIVDKMNTKYDPDWVKLAITGATIGLFAFLLAPRMIPIKAPFWSTVLISACTMMLINKLFAKYQRLQELSLGLSMLAGMYITVAIFG